MQSYEVSFKEAVVRFFQNYTNFSGRATRAEYWKAWVIVNLAGSIVISIISLILTLLISAIFGEDSLLTVLGYTPSFLYYMLTLIPWLSISARRLHDVGKPFWWFWVIGVLGSCCCGIGELVILILALMPSQPGSNQWGPNPYGINDVQGYNGNNNMF